MGSPISQLLQKDSVFLILFKTLHKVLLIGFIIIIARRLTQEEFGDFQFVMGIANLIVQPTIIITLIIARVGCSFSFETQRENLQWLYQRFRPYTIIVSFVIVVFFALLDPWLRELGNVEEAGSFIIAGLFIAIHIPYSFNTGVLQALEAFRAIGLLFFIIGCITLTLGLGMIWLNTGVLYAYTVQAFAILLSLFIMIKVVKRLLPKNSKPVKGYSFSLHKFSLYIFIATIAFFILFNMDIILTKILFNRVEAGYYSRLELIGKMSFLLSSSIAMVIFARASKDYGQGKDPITFLVKGSALYMGISFSAGILILLFSKYFFYILCGSSFVVNKYILSLLITAKIFQSYIFLLINYQGAVIKYRIAYIIGGILIVQSAMFTLNHDTLSQIAINILIPSIAGSIILLTYILFKTKSQGILLSLKELRN